MGLSYISPTPVLHGVNPTWIVLLLIYSGATESRILLKILNTGDSIISYEVPEGLILCTMQKYSMNTVGRLCLGLSL